MVTTAGVTVVGHVSEMLELHVMHDEHVVSVVRAMLAHVVQPAFDEHDAVTLRVLSPHCLCIHLECAHVDVMRRECDPTTGAVILRI